jgi:2-polyprenyl-3-methyl-5-hydroxy-6-metoxy-1,4-benzoquinol methylase
MIPLATAQPQAILAFDRLAKRYDDLFTRSLIGRAQRSAVWDVLDRTFRCGDHVLELNCGTGEDALFLAGKGVSVVACDASEQMIEYARRRHSTEAPSASVKFTRLPTERIAELRTEGAFDGVFSNFSGLNCVADLSQTAADLATLVPPGAPLIICLSTRFCISEIIWFLLHGKPREAFRRCSGYAAAKVGEFVVDVYYPTLYQVQKSFSPSFVMRSCVGMVLRFPHLMLNHGSSDFRTCCILCVRSTRFSHPVECFE